MTATGGMITAILAGGAGRRIAGHGDADPKPLVKIAGKPMLLRVIEQFQRQGLRDFVVATGHRANEITDFFTASPRFQKPAGDAVQSVSAKTFLDRDVGGQVTLVDTGVSTERAQRLMRLKPFLANEAFQLCYCDAFTDLDFHDFQALHRVSGRMVTALSVNARDRFGVFEFDGEEPIGLREKTVDPSRWINAGFFVLQPKVFDEIRYSDQSLETDILPRLIEKSDLNVYRHRGDWYCVDTLKDRDEAEKRLADAERAARRSAKALAG